MAAAENNAIAISGRSRSHAIAIETRVNDNANNTLAIISPPLIISLIIGNSSVRGRGWILHTATELKCTNPNVLQV